MTREAQLIFFGNLKSQRNICDPSQLKSMEGSVCCVSNRTITTWALLQKRSGQARQDSIKSSYCTITFVLPLQKLSKKHLASRVITCCSKSHISAFRVAYQMSKNGYLPKTGSFLVAEGYSQQWPIFWLMYLFRFSINKCVSFVKKKNSAYIY